MNYRQFLSQAVEEEKAQVMLTFAGHRPQLEGAMAGLKACLDKSPPQLAELLQRAYLVKHQALHETLLDRYWRVCCFFNEVEWICHVVSVALINEGVDPIIRPTMKAAIVASRITKSELSAN